MSYGLKDEILNEFSVFIFLCLINLFFGLKKDFYFYYIILYLKNLIY